MWPPPVIKDPSPPAGSQVAAAAAGPAASLQPKERNYFNETLKVKVVS